MHKRKNNPRQWVLNCFHSGNRTFGYNNKSFKTSGQLPIVGGKKKKKEYCKNYRERNGK